MGNSRKYSVLFVALFAFILAGLLYFSTTSIGIRFFDLMADCNEYLYYGYDSTVPFIEQVQEQNSYTKLIVGDSVANQLFDDLQEYNDTYCIAGSNRAIGITGQYFLVSEFLKAHPDATDVYLAITFRSLRIQFDTQTGYMYEVVPFTLTDTFDVDEDTYALVEDTYGKLAMNRYVQRLFVTSPVMSKIYYSYLLKHKDVPIDGDDLVTDVAYKYLMKIEELCDENDVDFHMVALPVADMETTRAEIAQVGAFLAERTDIETVIDFADSTLYYDIMQFTDGQHFNEDEVDLNDIVREIVEKTGELEDLKLE